MNNERYNWTLSYHYMEFWNLNSKVLKLQSHKVKKNKNKQNTVTITKMKSQESIVFFGYYEFLQVCLGPWQPFTTESFANIVDVSSH